MKIIIKTTVGVYIMLCELHKKFEKTLEYIGVMKTLPTALFCETPFGIHFKIGSFKKIYLHKGINPVYLRSAFYRARTLFDNLPVHPNSRSLPHGSIFHFCSAPHSKLLGS